VEIYIVGLGNPGPEYELTRHNIGFIVVDNFVEGVLKSSWFRKYRGLYTSGEVNGKKVHVLKPLTFMNNSGESVSMMLEKGKEDYSSLLVVHDDIDMDFGKIKFKFNGSDGGHRGVRSIISHLGSNKFWHLKMGIGRKGSSVVDYVLSVFDDEQMDFLNDFVDLGVRAIEAFVIHGPQKSMSEFNGKSVVLN